MKIYTKKITPAEAAKFLQKNSHNRSIVQAHVDFLADQMSRGEWRRNAATIAFDKEGYVFDGQHRLMAVVKSGVTLEFTIIEGLERSAFGTQDTGIIRTGGDAATIAGHPNGKVLAATAKVINRYQRREMYSSGGRMPNPRLLELIETLLPDIAPAVERGKIFYHRSGARLTPTTAASAYYIFAKLDKVAAENFFYKLESGVGLAEGEMILVLRRQLEARRGQSTNTGKESAETNLARVIKAWNLIRRGSVIKHISIVEGDLTNAGFPIAL